MHLLLVISIILSLSSFLHAQELETDAIDSLKIEANHNFNRLKNYKTESANNEIFDREREKGLQEFLEEQELWDLVRERGLKDYKKSKKELTPTEGSPEFVDNELEFSKQKNEYEKSRKAYVNAREKVRRAAPQGYAVLESKEYEGIYSDRPRYELRKRSKNKYVGSTKPGSGGYSSGITYNPDSYAPSAPVSDFPPPPPPPEFPPAPSPYEGFEEVPPPIYDGSAVNGMPYDPNYGGEMVPPPPPPPVDYDF